MGRAISVEEWLHIEDEIDAFSIIKSHKDKSKPKEYYRLLFSNASWFYDSDDFDRVLELWRDLDRMGEIDL